MDKTTLKTLVKQASRHYIIVMAFGVLLGFLVTTLVRNQIANYRDNQMTDAMSVEDVISVPVSLNRSQPIHLEIPRMNLDASFVPPLGLNDDRTVSVPDSYTEVGWYSGGASPGEVGPAVILGHVDSYQGPAIFYSLGLLKEGDEIKIEREDGTKLTFVVTESHRYPQSAFPTELVYGPVDYPALRLVTCSGIFNKGAQRYSHNLVVYAKLKSDQ